MRKDEILKLVIQALEKEENLLIDAALDARDAATEAEAKPEHKYDTRGLEQSYLAGAQAKRAVEIKESIQSLKSLPLQSFQKSSVIDITALVEVQSEEGESKLYFILPERGGVRIEIAGQELYTLSSESPLGQNLIGKTNGDSIEVNVKGQVRHYKITAIH